jgi:protein-tyrosine phosphatase
MNTLGVHVGRTGQPCEEPHDGRLTERSRLLPLAGASNFRDLGGYPTTDGAFTCWGRLFRSDTLHELTEGDVALLRDMGLKSIIDLRTATESELSGRGLLGAEAADYFHLSLIDADGGESRGVPAPIDESLANRYLWYLDIGRDALAQAIRLLGDASRYPLVFHCAAGKDRTGVLTALILDIVGVERRAIVEDYVLTASRMDAILERLLRNRAEGGMDYQIPPGALTVEAATMEGFLDGVDQRHGGARQWALAAGVPYDAVEALSTLLVTTALVPRDSGH